jgi:hypothetical protein
MVEAPEDFFTANNDNSLIVVVNSNVKTALYRCNCGKSRAKHSHVFTSSINSRNKHFTRIVAMLEFFTENCDISAVV